MKRWGILKQRKRFFNNLKPYYEKRLAENPNDRTALSSLANIHHKLGNSDLAREYRVKTDPTLAWEGQVLPEFSPVVDLDGKPVSLADYRGKLVLLDFWATWCGPVYSGNTRTSRQYTRNTTTKVLRS